MFKHAQAVAKKHRVDPRLVMAVVKVESGHDRMAVSSKGAKGLMQLMPATAKAMGVDDPHDPAQNLDGGTRYLAYLLKMFKGDIDSALAAYNAGPKRHPTPRTRCHSRPPERRPHRILSKPAIKGCRWRRPEHRL